MKKTRNEMTMTEALRDPLIAQVMRADGVQPEDFRALLETAALKISHSKPASRLGFMASLRQPSAGCCMSC